MSYGDRTPEPESRLCRQCTVDATLLRVSGHVLSEARAALARLSDLLTIDHETYECLLDLAHHYEDLVYEFVEPFGKGAGLEACVGRGQYPACPVCGETFEAAALGSAPG